MTTLTELSPETYRRAADIREKILELEEQLKQLLGETAPSPAETQAPSRTTRGGRGRSKVARAPGKRSSNGLTTNQAILKVLEKGLADVPTIISKVTQMKGKASKAAIVQALVVLKKQGQITNPERGQYVIKKATPASKTAETPSSTRPAKQSKPKKQLSEARLKGLAKARAARSAKAKKAKAKKAVDDVRF